MSIRTNLGSCEEPQAINRLHSGVWERFRQPNTFWVMRNGIRMYGNANTLQVQGRSGHCGEVGDLYYEF